MSKRFRKLSIKLALIGSVLYITVLTLIPKSTTQQTQPIQDTKKIERQIEQEIQSRSDIEIKKHLLQSKLSNAKLFVDRVESDVEYILQTISGEYTATLDSKPEDNFADWLVDSTMTLNLHYKAIVSIPAHKIETVIDKSGMVSINYDASDITVKAVEITSYNATEDKKMFGHRYTKDEILATIELSQEKIRDKINTNDEIISKSAQSLERHMKSLANDLRVSAVRFNNKYIENISKYEFIDSTNVKYGHPNELRNNKIEYIVVHSTSNPNVDAEAHVKYLNTNPNSNAANYYVDYDSAQYTLDLDMYPYHVGNETNGSSIGIEVCEFTDEEKQLQAISNTKDLIDILQAEFPDAELVFHKDLSGKNCPSLAFGKDAKYTPNELIDLLGMN